MIVITETRIVKCSELCLSGQKIIGFVDNCKDCSFIVGCYASGKEARVCFNKVTDILDRNGENTVIDFRRLTAEV